MANIVAYVGDAQSKPHRGNAIDADENSNMLHETFAHKSCMTSTEKCDVLQTHQIDCDTHRHTLIGFSSGIINRTLRGPLWATVRANLLDGQTHEPELDVNRPAITL
jgi:hypothetical protein